MIGKLLPRKTIPLAWLRLIVIILLGLGICFRFVHLDRKIYWTDETYTSLRISGYTETELIQQVFTGDLFSIEELHQYQQPNPDKGLGDTIKSLASESPQHPPLYYVLVRFWVQFFGDSIAVTRSLSAFISLLVFPGIYWLCRELFPLPLTGWIAVALVAISPFHILYAQEAREYSLWTVAIALSSAALLAAIRLKSRLSWGVYAATVAFSLYTFTFSLLVVLGYGIYVVAREGWRLSQTAIAYALATAAGLLAFSPWIFAIVTNFSQAESTADWTEQKVAFGFLLQRWIVNLSYIFFDLNSGYKYLQPTQLALLALVIYSLYFLLRHTSKNSWLFVFTLIGTTALALALPDLILGGIRSIHARYLIPSYLGIQLAVAYAIANKISLSKLRQQKLWQLLWIAMLVGSIFSVIVSSQAEFWWNKSPSKHRYNPEIAAIINRAPHPLLISDDSREIVDCFACRILALSYLLQPQVKLQLVVNPNIPKIPSSYKDIFLFSPSEVLRQGIEKTQAYESELVFQRDNFWLWKLVKH